MTFERSFCPSPWFHMRINNSGTYEYCRAQAKDGSTRVDFVRNIKSLGPSEYFKTHMAEIRTQLLNGQSPSGCSDCVTMEQHNKVSPRQRQLLKIGVLPNHFESSLASSPYRPELDYSWHNQGMTRTGVVDWQIDLGNYCNGACVFCSPESSSRLATEFVRIGLADTLPPASWCDDPDLLNKFCQDLNATENLQYIHFLGGETVITPGFKIILESLVQSGRCRDITVGFTTNLTVWSDSVVALLTQFKSVHLGMSIETLTPVNDYVRWPSQQQQTRDLLQRWHQLAVQHGWLTQLRITPTCLTIHDITTVYDYAWQRSMAVESCNFLYEPAHLRISVLPAEYRQPVIEHLIQWVKDHPIQADTQLVNTRDPTQNHTQIVQDAQSYINYLRTAQDESHRLPALTHYLKKLEASRNNSIVSYLPQYEELFRNNGY